MYIPISMQQKKWIPNSKKLKISTEDNKLIINSNLDKNERAAYLHFDKLTSFASPNESYIKVSKSGLYVVNFEGIKDPKVVCSLYVIGYTDSERVQTEIIYLNKSRMFSLNQEVKSIKIAIRIHGSGQVVLNKLNIENCEKIERIRELMLPSNILPNNSNEKYLVLTNIYASDENLYRNGFVHRRVQLYKEHGLKVDVFSMQGGDLINKYKFQGVDVYNGNRNVLEEFLLKTNYKKILVHFINEDMYETIKNICPDKEIIVWIHAVECESWTRRIFNIEKDNFEKKMGEMEENYYKRNLIRHLFMDSSINIKFIFISEFIKKIACEDSGVNLSKERYDIIHNIIDTDLFVYKEKDINQRKKILSIRPFANRNYGNDMTVNCILELSKEPFFKDIEFDIYGDGRLYDNTIKDIEKFKNVNIHRKFLTQHEIAKLHRDFGIFICPTRWDTQGVSRGEAMASGMVVITNDVAAIPEFIDNNCAMIADEEDFKGMAKAIKTLYEEPNKFKEISYKGYIRTKKQTGTEVIINKELNVIIN